MRSLTVASSSWSSPSWRLLLLVCACVTALSFLFASSHDRHNPVSHFFRPDATTYAAGYSDERARAGRQYLLEASQKLDPDRHNDGARADLAVVVLTVARPALQQQQQYLDASLGSLLEAIDADARRHLFINVVFGDADPETHPLFHADWLRRTADELTVRRLPSSEEWSPSSLPPLHVSPMPADAPTTPPKTSAWHQKATLDYAMALLACGRAAAAARASHCLVLEDDTVLASSWHAELRAYLAQAHQWPAGSWGHMRLFYAEKYFGWEDTEVGPLVASIASLTAAVALVLRVVLRARLATTAVVCVFVAAQLVLLVLAGRNHVFPVARGLSTMNTRGCCTQAIVYPTALVDELARHLVAHAGERPYDISLDAHLAARGLAKLATHPPLVQHIGAASSRAHYARASPLWSFAFERRRPR
ncbi:hypothetical protein FA10DRAFT_60323 [Acaromyces ingoldii]|uniref:Integral membrane protein n=1 Tax=Acaromyces ingoldii TaxID=215250 RepID=A0A316YQN5_9BASI|nr:hypothetical protein FA10DRAFT_60323 [Acaromyces ingoldii]PWN91124.1 hypothetical protein FA10DRAFT_60323 [Acaromyces ingoldii]